MKLYENIISSMIQNNLSSIRQLQELIDDEEIPVSGSTTVNQLIQVLQESIEKYEKQMGEENS